VLCKLNTAIIAVSLFGQFAFLAPPSALAITADIAKKCSALTAKAYPPRVVGNPAAGVQNGTYQDFRNYFNKCVANNGNPPEQENQKNTQSPNAGGSSQPPQQNKPAQQNK
jgi:hypothetical protein